MGETLVNETNNLEIWIPAVVSIVTLIINLLFYVFVQPRITYKTTAREALAKTSIEFLNYLTELVSFDNFEGVPTTVRKYSLQIHLHFKSGTADGEIELLLEKIFKETQKRKTLNSETEIENWNDSFRVLVRELRKNLAKYCGEL